MPFLPFPHPTGMFPSRSISLVSLLILLSAQASLYARSEAGYPPQVSYTRKIDIHGISNAGGSALFCIVAVSLNPNR